MLRLIQSGSILLRILLVRILTLLSHVLMVWVEEVKHRIDSGMLIRLASTHFLCLLCSFFLLLSFMRLRRIPVRGPPKVSFVPCERKNQQNPNENNKERHWSYIAVFDLEP